MAKDRFEFGLIGTAEEIAEYLTSLAAGLKRGEVSLESGERALRLVPPADVKLELNVGTRTNKGRIKVEVGWKRRDGARAGDLYVEVDSRSGRS
jgi:amphi-Trp domain-containing protein